MCCYMLLDSVGQKKSCADETSPLGEAYQPVVTSIYYLVVHFEFVNKSDYTK